jgi:hypothetical protein
LKKAVTKTALVNSVKTALMTKTAANPRVGLKIGVDAATGGVCVRSVNPEGLAAATGKFVPGDLVTHINGESLSGLTERDVMQRVADAQSLEFTLRAAAPAQVPAAAAAASSSGPSSSSSSPAKVQAGDDSDGSKERVKELERKLAEQAEMLALFKGRVKEMVEEVEESADTVESLELDADELRTKVQEANDKLFMLETQRPPQQQSSAAASGGRVPSLTGVRPSSPTSPQMPVW